MTTKFFEEFTVLSKGEFPMLKLNSATYYKDSRELIVRFIISAFEVRDFNDESKNKVQEIVEQMFSGIKKIDIQYIRTYADVSVVKNKILEFFNRTNQMIFRRLNDDNMQISVGEHDIDIILSLDTPTYKMILAGNLLEKLHDCLDCSFNYDINIQPKEVVALDASQNDDDELRIDTTVESIGGDLRLVDIRCNQKIYARGKVDSISQMPNYIIDITGAGDNVVLCGKISNIDKKTYKNKKYDANNAKSGPETLPMIKFWLDDTTAKMDCVCFASRDEDVQRILDLRDQDTVVCTGKVSMSQFSGNWSYMINAIFACDINFDSIKLIAKKPVPPQYKTILPQEYSDNSQKSLLDFDADEGVNDYFKGKTLVVFDLETTDKKTDLAEIIEIAALKVVDGKPTQTFQTLVKPIASISEEITNLTHISNAMVLDAPNIDAVMPDFFKFSRDSILVGQNIAGFDFPIVNRIAEKMGYNFDNQLVDTLLLARKYLTELPNFKLETMSKFFKISHNNAHRAMSDVLATFEVLKIIAKRM